MMEPITGWNYVFYIGNLFADTAIALFAIEAGYIDKKHRDIGDKYNNLTTKLKLIKDVEKDINRKIFQVLQEELDGLESRSEDPGEFNAEYRYYEEVFEHFGLDHPDYPHYDYPHDSLPIEENILPSNIIFFIAVYSKSIIGSEYERSYKLNKLLEKLMKTEKYKKELDEIYKSVHDYLKGDYYLYYTYDKEDTDLNRAKTNFEHRLSILDDVFEHGRRNVEKKLRSTIESVEMDYTRINKLKQIFNKYSSNETVLWLFVSGIAIQIIALFLSGWIGFPLFQIFILMLSPAILILALLAFFASKEWL